MAMITGSWNMVELVCGNHPDTETPPKMIIVSGPHSLFYACPKHDPLNRGDNEQVCFNRINLIEYDKMLNHLAKTVMDAEERNERIDLRHHKWKSKSLHFEVLEYSEEKIVVKFVDTLAIQGHKV